MRLRTSASLVRPTLVTSSGQLGRGRRPSITAGASVSKPAYSSSLSTEFMLICSGEGRGSSNVNRHRHSPTWQTGALGAVPCSVSLHGRWVRRAPQSAPHLHLRRLAHGPGHEARGLKSGGDGQPGQASRVGLEHPCKQRRAKNHCMSVAGGGGEEVTASARPGTAAHLYQGREIVAPETSARGGAYWRGRPGNSTPR